MQEKNLKKMEIKLIIKWIILISSWLFLLFAIVYMVMNVEEIKASDMRYCAKKADVTCNCWNEDVSFMVNGTTQWAPKKYYNLIS